MKIAVQIIWLVLFALCSNAQQVITQSNINLHLLPTTDSKIVYQIPRGTAIKLHDCHNKWCKVSISGHSGFVAEKYALTTKSKQSNAAEEQPHATEPIRHYVNSKGNVVQSPTHYDKPPAGATAQCRDGTYSFSQSRRGTCSHHGGVARWLQ